jgi:hypothetical protein
VRMEIARQRLTTENLQACLLSVTEGLGR